jgi:hypothetical protein
MDSADKHTADLGRMIRNEVGKKALPKKRIDHALFTLSGNGPIGALAADFEAAEKGRHHAVINLHIVDYSNFLTEIYEEVTNLGDD